MSYITLHLTLEYVFVPKMRWENSRLTDKHISGEKFKYFQELLLSPPGHPPANKSAFTFRDHLAYSATFWTFGQHLGIASLLMIAVSGEALMKIAKRSGPRSMQIPKLTTALGSLQTWWAASSIHHTATSNVSKSGADTSIGDWRNPQKMPRKKPANQGAIAVVIVFRSLVCFPVDDLVSGCGWALACALVGDNVNICGRSCDPIQVPPYGASGSSRACSKTEPRKMAGQHSYNNYRNRYQQNPNSV